jgi:hypothetical protein
MQTIHIYCIAFGNRARDAADNIQAPRDARDYKRSSSLVVQYTNQRDRSRRFCILVRGVRINYKHVYRYDFSCTLDVDVNEERVNVIVAYTSYFALISFQAYFQNAFFNYIQRKQKARLNILMNTLFAYDLRRSKCSPHVVICGISQQ